MRAHAVTQGGKFFLGGSQMRAHRGDPGKDELVEVS